MYGIFLAPGTKATCEGMWAASVPVKEFVALTAGVEIEEFANKMESYCLSGVTSKSLRLRRRTALTYRSEENAADRKRRLKTEVSNLIQTAFRKSSESLIPPTLTVI